MVEVTGVTLQAQEAVQVLMPAVALQAQEAVMVYY